MDVVDVLLSTGARIGEVLTLRWQDLDLEATPPTLTIAGTITCSKGKHPSRSPETKTASGFRTVVLPSYVVSTLTNRLASSAYTRGDGAIFSTRNGEWYSPKNVRRSLRNALKDSEFEWVTPQTLRRSVATAIDRSSGSQDAASQLGHSSDAVTKAHYIAKAAQAPDLTELLELFGPTTE